jgi:enamine deaminase RidA (YjgF/YER057c/UK114 family)
MAITHLNPSGMTENVPYHHVSIGTGSRTVFVAGQVDRDEFGSPVSDGGLAGQVLQALRNVSTGLTGAGASFADVVRLTIYVTEWRSESIGELMNGLEAATLELALPTPLPPTSVIGVAALFEPDVRVEIEATAIID